MLQRFKHCVSCGFIDRQCKDFYGALSQWNILSGVNIHWWIWDPWDWNPGSSNLSSAGEGISRNEKAAEVPPPLERNAINRNELWLGLSSSLCWVPGNEELDRREGALCEKVLMALCHYQPLECQKPDLEGNGSAAIWEPWTICASQMSLSSNLTVHITHSNTLAYFVPRMQKKKVHIPRWSFAW